MSLINDALRRARQSQKVPPVLTPETPPPPPHSAPVGAPLPLDPVEPPPLSPWPSFLSIAVTALLVIGLIGLGGWFIWKSWDSKRSKRIVTSAAMSNLPRATQTTNVVGTHPKVAPSVTPVASASAEVTVALAAKLAPLPVAKPTDPVPSVAPVAVALPSPPVKWPPLKLQGIFYRPPRSSVMVNKQTLFIDDVIEGARVVEIGLQSVTLVLGGQTNVMILR